jgi:tRNA1(Val) A37 N6-methylase TrmN6
MKSDGRLALVLPVSTSAAFLKVAEHNGLLLQKRMTIIPIEGREPNRLNLEFSLYRPDGIHEEVFVIRNADKQFTQQYREFLKDFYLGL